ncbi:transposase [Rickettsiales endosymbiont of Peranema trichophorum]|uniref:transposase n=1 Tax=Rickettsiales endosymbiont of Peranema trichophorum TaxID=2486577 RepID=UPI00102363FB|nr:transposase [Rickettsiales endosymbiont of Peranema trichophorum]RZI47627.1 transposase [Rickettsiales endosymbiont of Peranema trichophorum]
MKIKQFGRSRKEHRVMLALAMLQAMYNGSDTFAEEELKENMYWQYFCGFEYVRQDVDVSEATIRRFRGILGEGDYNEILKELLRIGVKVGALKKKDLESAIIDTTVQIKNVKHPHDGLLMEKARKEVVNLCRKVGIELNEFVCALCKAKNTIL